MSQGTSKPKACDDDEYGWTLVDIANELGITRQRVLAIQNRALRKLAKSRLLKEFANIQPKKDPARG